MYIRDFATSEVHTCCVFCHYYFRQVWMRDETEEHLQVNEAALMHSCNLMLHKGIEYEMCVLGLQKVQCIVFTCLMERF